MASKNTIIIGAAVAAVAIAIAAAASVSMAPQEQGAMDAGTESGLSGEITIGYIFPLTGELASHGEENMEAAKLGVADFNEYLEERGEQWSLRLIGEDSATNPVIALDKLTALNARGVDVIIGPETSSNIRNMRAYSDANDMMMVSCCSTAPALAIEGDSVFRFTTNDENQGVVLAKLAQKSGIEVIVPIYRGDAWGDGLVAAVKESFAGTVDEGIRYNPEIAEYSASTSILGERVGERIEEVGAGKVAVLLTSFAEGVQILQSAAGHPELAMVQWYGSDGNSQDQQITEDPIAGEFAASVSFSAPIIAVADNEKNADVSKRLSDLLGREPITYAYGSYDAAWVVGKAIMEAQSASASDLKPIFIDVANEYTGALGDIQLNAAGDLAVADYEVWTVNDRQWLMTESYSYVTGEFRTKTSALSGEITIGSILPLTGELASHGEENMEATKLGVADFNDFLERSGEQWRLKLVSEDSATNPVTALEKLTALNARDIDIVIGPETSSNIRNMRAYSDANDMMLISCCSTAPALAIEGDSVFRFTTNDENQGVVMAKLAQGAGIETLVPIYRGDAWGDGLVAAIADNFAGTVDEGIRYNPELPEFSASASLLADRVGSFSDVTTAVVLISFSEGAQIIQSAAQYDSLKQVQWYGSDGNAKDQKISTDPIASEFAEAVSFSAPIIAVDDNEVNADLRQRLMDMLGREPITYTYGSYDAAWVVGKAIMEAQSGSASDIKPIFMDVANAHSGALGDIQLNAAGDLAVADYEVWTARDGSWTSTAKYSYATGKLSSTSTLSGEISIGSILPLTGELASHGEENMEATKLGVADFNDFLEQSGEQWRLKLVSEDSATNPVTALEKLTALNARDIDIVIGPETSSNIRNMRAYSDANDMMLISCCSTAPALAIEGDSVFRFTTNDENQGVVLAKLAQKAGIDTLVPIYRGDAWGDGLVGAVTESFGGTVNEGIRYNPELPEFSASASLLADRVQGMDPETTAVLLISFSEGAQIIQSATQYDSLRAVQWYGSDGNAKDQKITGDPIAGEFAEAVSFSAPIIAVDDNEVNADLRQRLMDMLGREPITYTYGSYDAAWVVGKAIMEAQSGSASDIKPIFMDVANAHSGALGDIQLNAAGDLAVADYEVWTAQNGGWESTDKYLYSTGSFEAGATELSGEITIGSILPLTGELASHGEENMEATKLGVADFNDFLEQSGEQWRLKLVSEDSATNPVTALEKLTALNARNIDIVIGPETSSNIRNMRAYSDANDMMLISCCSTAPALAIEGDSVFRFTTNDENQGVVMAKLAQRDQIETLVPIYRGDAWGDGLVAAITDSFEGTVDRGIRYNPELPEFSASASLLADVVSSMDSETTAVVLISFSEGAQIIQSAAQYDSLKQVQWYGSDGNAKDQKISTDPIASEFAEAVSFSAPIIAVDDNEVNADLRQRLMDMLGREPITYTYGSYDAAWVVGKAIMQAQSGSASDIKPIFMDVANAHSGALGDIQLNAAGDLAVADYEVWTAMDGSWTSTAKYSYMTNQLS